MVYMLRTDIFKSTLVYILDLQLTSLMPCWWMITKDSSLASIVSSTNMATTSLLFDSRGIDCKSRIAYCMSINFGEGKVATVSRHQYFIIKGYFVYFLWANTAHMHQQNAKSNSDIEAGRTDHSCYFNKTNEIKCEDVWFDQIRLINDRWCQRIRELFRYK